MYDAETGVPLLSSVTNEFDNPIYTYNYAAHWYYPGMEPAYRNIGYIKTDAYPSGNTLAITAAESAIYTPGDELLVAGGSGTLLTVKSVEETSPGSGNWQLVFYGDVTIPTGPVDLKVIRSGHRNQQAAMAGKTVFLEATGVGNSVNQSVVAYFLQLLIDETSSGTNLSTNGGFMCAYDTDPAYEIVFDELTVMLGCTPGGFCLDYNNSSSITLSIYYFLNGGGDCPGGTGQDPGCTVILTNPNTGQAVIGADVKPFLADWTVRNTQSMIPNAIFEIHDGSNTFVAVQTDICNYPSISEDFTYDKILHAEASTYSDEWTLDFEDANFHDGAVAQQNTSTYNPYVYGEKGIFRVSSSYAYKEAREQVSLDVINVQSPSLADQGTYVEFVPFDWLGAAHANWIYSNSVSRVSPRGYALENTNALDIPSAALYGYDQTLPVMRAVNARYDEIASTGFEDIVDFESTNSGGSSDNHFGHFGIYDLAKVSNVAAHTGDYSLEVDNSSAASTTMLETRVNGNATIALRHQGEYLVSMWVKEAGLSRPKTLSALVSSEYETGSSCTSGSFPMSPSGPVVEGWQKIEGKITLPAAFLCSDGSISIDLVFTGDASTTAYVDDVRLQPYESEATVYVYDPVSKRYEAMLDGNNFATFYDYDEEGNLIRLRRETEEGIRLLQEYHSHVKTQP